MSSDSSDSSDDQLCVGLRRILFTWPFLQLFLFALIFYSFLISKWLQSHTFIAIKDSI